MAKNYFYNLLLTLANLLFPILSFPYVSRILGPEAIGQVQFVFSFAFYFAVIAGLGVPIYGLQEIARNRNDLNGRSKAFSEIMVIYIVSSIFFSIIYIAAIYLFPYFSPHRHLYLVALSMVLLSCANIDWIYTGLEEFKTVAIRSVLIKLISLLIMYTCIKTTADYPYYLYLMIGSVMLNNLLNILFLGGKVRLRFSNLNVTKHIKPLIFMFGTTVVVIMADLDTVLIGFLSNTKIVGYYTVADKLSTITVPIVSSMSVIMLPKIAAYFADNDLVSVQTALDQCFRFLVFLGIPVSLGLGLLAPEFIGVFSGRAFLPATNSMRLLSVLPFTMGFSRFFQHLLLVPSGLNRQMFICVLCGLFSSLLLNVLLIPQFQQIGASIANLCSELVVTSAFFYVVRKNFSFTYKWTLVIKALISAIVFIPIIVFIRTFSLPSVFTLLLSIGVCGLTYISVQLFVFKNNFVVDAIALIKDKVKTA